MVQQVSGSDRTLLEAIRDEEVPSPDLMSWNDWQAWRSTTGRMPRAATDGYSVTRAQESALWKAVMLDLYGEDWSIRLVSAEADAPEPAAPATGPALTPVVPRPSDSPGSGVDPRMVAGTVTASDPGSGVQTPKSWNSQSPGTPGGLTRRVLKPFQPEGETLEQYTDRVQRQARALEKWRKHH